MLDLYKSITLVFFCVSLFSPMILIDSKATGHFIGKKPTDTWIASHPASKISPEIQASECAFNLRTPGEVFAYFKINPAEANYNGAPYGTCYACTAVPKSNELVDDKGYDVFFWDNSSGQPGPGTGPIKNPKTGTTGYEDSHGVYADGVDPNDRSSSKLPTYQGGKQPTNKPSPSRSTSNHDTKKTSSKPPSNGRKKVDSWWPIQGL